MSETLSQQADLSHNTFGTLEGFSTVFSPEARVAAAVLNGPLCVFETVTDRFLQLVGKTPQELLHRSIFQDTVFRFSPGLQSLLDGLRAGGEPLQFTEHKALITRGSKTETVWLNGFFFRLPETERIAVFLTDVTEKYLSRFRDKEELAMLRQTKEQLELSISIGHIGIWHWDVRNDVLTWSKEQLELYGLKEGEFGGRMQDFHRLVLPEDIELLKSTSKFERLADGEYEYRFRIRRADGEMRWIQGRSRSFFDSNGDLNYRTGVNVDITERQKTEEALRQSEERFRSTFDNAAVGIAHVSPDGKWLEVNNRLCDIVGYTQEELLSSTFQKITHPEDLDADLQLLEQVLTGKIKTYTLEKRYIHKSGTAVWINLTVSLVRYSDGRPKYFISVVEDISERKRAEEKIIESEARYRSLAAALESLVAERTMELQQSQSFLQSVLDTTQNGIATYEPIRNRQGEVVDFRIAYINNMITRDLGLLPSDVTGKTVGEVFPEAFANGAFDYLKNFVETGESNHREIIHPTPEGDLFLDLSLARMEEGVTVTVRNVSEQKKAAQQLEALNKKLKETNAELERSNEDLQQFAHVASHDLKEPIRKVRTFGSRLEDEFGDILPERGKLYLQKVLSSAERMFGLIDGVLNYSTINSLDGAIEEVNLNELIGHIETDLEVLLHDSGGRLNKGVMPTVKGSAVLLNQLFYNLLNNALKFAKPGTPSQITIDYRRVAGGQIQDVAEADWAKEFFEIRVCDNGIGFRAEYAQKIFKTFTRLNSRDRYEGTGLGLALCKKIVERHSGYIYATGKEGEGACFYVLLPA